VPHVGRLRELRELGDLLNRADSGAGGHLGIIGPPGSGKTALTDAIVAVARHRGFDVLRASPVRGRPGLLVWAQLLRDVGTPDELAVRLLADPGPMDLDDAARLLVAGPRRLIVVDDIAATAPKAAAHLHAAIRTGLSCRYEPTPDGPTRWHV
jgi:AAA ATPase domain